MSNYWAKFVIKNNHLFRFDTRIYLKSVLSPTEKDCCIGAVVGKNPGSAQPFDKHSSAIQKIQLNNDQLLPNIKSIFVRAYERGEKMIPKNAYVQVLNLFYLCDRNFDQAIHKLESHPNHAICGTEEKHFPFLWYVWGGQKRKLNLYKSRILNIKSDKHFFLDTHTEKVVSVAPRYSDAARHTQGMRHDLIVPFISTIL